MGAIVKCRILCTQLYFRLVLGLFCTLRLGVLWGLSAFLASPVDENLGKKHVPLHVVVYIFEIVGTEKLTPELADDGDEVLLVRQGR